MYDAGIPDTDTDTTTPDTDPPTPAEVYVRRDAWGLQESDPWEPVTLAYARAIAEMQTREPDDPTSWAYQAAIHGSYSPAPAGATWDACQHGSWYFLPWHRLYLYYFERIVRSVVLSQGGPEDWALPYWDYDKGPPSNTLPPAFRQPTLPDGAPNPLFLGGPLRAPGINEGAGLPAHATSSAAALGYQNYSGSPEPGLGGGVSAPVHFARAFGALENRPHNIVHDLIGGRLSGSGPCTASVMNDPRCAALDPIFWLHHANIDRLWSAWIALGDGRADPSQPQWRDQEFTFCDESGATVTRTCADVLDTVGQLGYRYETPAPAVPPSPSVRMSAAPPPDEPPELVGATDEPIVLAGGSASVDVAVEAPAVASRTLAAREQGRPPRIYLRVEDIEGERNPGIGYDVYLNPTGDEPGEERYVGTVSFFGIEHLSDLDRDHEGPAGLRHVFDVTEVVEELRRQGDWDDEHLTVTFRPLGLEPPAGMDRSVTAPPEGETPAVRIGRVSLFAE